MTRSRSRRRTKVLSLAGLCTLSFVAGLSAERYVIAYLPFGGGWSSRIVFNNPTDLAVNVELLFFSGDGSPLTLTESADPMSRQIRLGPGATQSVDVAGEQDGESQVGWAIAKADSPVQIFGTFDFSVPDSPVSFGEEDEANVKHEKRSPLVDCPLCVGETSSVSVDKIMPSGHPPDRPSFSVPVRVGRPPGRPPTDPGPGRAPGRPPLSVPRSTPSVTARVKNIWGATVLPSGDSFVFPVSVYGVKDFNAAFAVANPNESEAVISLELSYSDGLQKLIRVIQIPAHSQTTRSLTDPSLFNVDDGTPDRFDGSVTVCSNVPIGLVAIGLAGEMAFTLPVTSSDRCREAQ